MMKALRAGVGRWESGVGPSATDFVQLYPKVSLPMTTFEAAAT
jgi:hypothetical protein